MGASDFHPPGGQGPAAGMDGGGLHPSAHLPCGAQPGTWRRWGWAFLGSSAWTVTNLLLGHLICSA